MHLLQNCIVTLVLSTLLATPLPANNYVGSGNRSVKISGKSNVSKKKDKIFQNNRQASLFLSSGMKRITNKLRIFFKRLDVTFLAPRSSHVGEYYSQADF